MKFWALYYFVGIGILSLIIMYKHRVISRRKVGDMTPDTKTKLARRGARNRRDTPWHLFHVERNETNL